MYSEKVMEHFLRPKNLGELKDFNGVGLVGDPDCGDHLKVWIKVEEGLIVDIGFKCQGCPAAIATSSMMTELVKGCTVEKASEITDHLISLSLGGLPEPKEHCSNLGAQALNEALRDYESKVGTSISNGKDQR